MDIQDIQAIKQRFKIIGNNPHLNRAIEIAVQVASTDLTVLINGESGTGKDVIPQIIHQNSSRKHKNYFAINCGAIPEGTIDSELFGHEKGSFTGAIDTRKGYFEVADGGTIFLDEVGELPLATQARLLRVLENGEFIKVGSSKVQKTDVRIVAATNLNIPLAIEKGKFREDLYYRLNTVPIRIPALRERKEDIRLLFRKFAADFAEKSQAVSASDFADKSQAAPVSNFADKSQAAPTSDFGDKSQAMSASDFGNNSQAGSTNGAAPGKATPAPNLFSAPSRPLSLGQVRGERSSAPLKKDAHSAVTSIHPEAPRASVPVPVLLRRSKKLLQRVKEEAANRR
jgi:sigma54-dependent transcription regulator